MISGTAYGVILNDRDQVIAMADAFQYAPYKSPPRAPILYIKPRTCFAFGGAAVSVPADATYLEVAATVAVLFGKDCCRVDANEAGSAIAAACLALDISEPHSDVYRPAIRERCRDGFLPLGRFGAVSHDPRLPIETLINGTLVHRWTLDRLVRSIAALAAEISDFMTLGAGDLLLVGLPGDAPRASKGDRIEVRAASLASLHTELVAEAAA